MNAAKLSTVRSSQGGKHENSGLGSANTRFSLGFGIVHYWFSGYGQSGWQLDGMALPFWLCHFGTATVSTDLGLRGLTLCPV